MLHLDLETAQSWDRWWHPMKETGRQIFFGYFAAAKIYEANGMVSVLSISDLK